MARGKYLFTDSDTITNQSEIAETLARSFAVKLSPARYINNSEELDWRRKMTKSTMLPFQKNNFVNLSLRKTGLTTGPDDIHYQFLKHLPDVSIYASTPE